MVAVGVRRLEAAGNQGLEVGAQRRDPGRLEGAERGPVVGDVAGEELDLARVAGPLVIGAGELDRRLDRLRAAVGEEDPVEITRRQRGDPLGELDRPRVPVAPDGHEVELADLRRHRVADLGPAVPGVDAEERREPVEIALAVLVVDVRTVAADDDRDLAVVVGAHPREVHPQVALGHLLQVRLGPRRRLGNRARARHFSSPPTTSGPLYLDVPYNGIWTRRVRQPGFGSNRSVRFGHYVQEALDLLGVLPLAQRLAAT